MLFDNNIQNFVGKYFNDYLKDYFYEEYTEEFYFLNELSKMGIWLKKIIMLDEEVIQLETPIDLDTHLLYYNDIFRSVKGAKIVIEKNFNVKLTPQPSILRFKIQKISVSIEECTILNFERVKIKDKFYYLFSLENEGLKGKLKLFATMKNIAIVPSTHYKIRSIIFEYLHLKQDSEWYKKEKMKQKYPSKASNDYLDSFFAYINLIELEKVEKSRKLWLINLRDKNPQSNNIFIN